MRKQRIIFQGKKYIKSLSFYVSIYFTVHQLENIH